MTTQECIVYSIAILSGLCFINEFMRSLIKAVTLDHELRIEQLKEKK